MTNKHDLQMDAIVASAIEDKPEGRKACGYGVSEGGAWIREWEVLDGEERPLLAWQPRPFITASTPELEWIVLKWVQDSELTVDFIDTLWDIQSERDLKHEYGQSYYLLFARYEIVDFAKALLSVLQEVE